jgi:hypothetical protein
VPSTTTLNHHIPPNNITTTLPSLHQYITSQHRRTGRHEQIQYCSNNKPKYGRLVCLCIAYNKFKTTSCIVFHASKLLILHQNEVNKIKTDQHQYKRWIKLANNLSSTVGWRQFVICRQARHNWQVATCSDLSLHISRVFCARFGPQLLHNRPSWLSFTDL